MQTTFTFGDAKSREEHAVALKSLLESRNNLVHGGLASFNWDSSGDCARLIGELGELNLAIGQQIDYFAAILRAISSIRPEDVELMVASAGESERSMLRVEGDA
jgi:hypothetical protein